MHFSSLVVRHLPEVVRPPFCPGWLSWCLLYWCHTCWRRRLCNRKDTWLILGLLVLAKVNQVTLQLFPGRTRWSVVEGSGSTTPVQHVTFSAARAFLMTICVGCLSRAALSLKILSGPPDGSVDVGVVRCGQASSS